VPQEFSFGLQNYYQQFALDVRHISDRLQSAAEKNEARMRKPAAAGLVLKGRNRGKHPRIAAGIGPNH